MNDLLDIRGCTNAKCPVRTSCGRACDLDIFSAGTHTWRGPDTKGECRGFVVRKALGGGGETDIVFRGSLALPGGRRRGRIHNAHAGVRKSYPGSEALFGQIFGRGKGGSRPSRPLVRDDVQRSLPALEDRGRPQLPQLPSPPDLMVKRHLRKGKDINNPEE
jgi:hypothetical protein